MMRRLLARLPDVPRWVETRGALLAGAGELFGSGDDCIVRIDEQRLLSVVGEPGSGELAAATEGIKGEWTLICPVESGELWSGLLPDWQHEVAVLHELPELPTRVPEPAIEARIERVTAPSPGWLDHAPLRLRREIAVVAGRRPLFAAWVEGRAVSFCYAALETETLWDVSIETLDRYRRIGLAGACATATIRHLALEGKRPVWAAVESNTASLGLASELGFRPVDRIAVLERKATR